jgi:four helix bundle protein
VTVTVTVTVTATATERATSVPARRQSVAMLSFQSLDVYRCSIEFLALCHQLASGFPRGHAALADQLRRAATSVPLNIAESQGRVPDADKARTYAIARGFAMECAAVLDVCRALGLIEDSRYQRGSELVERMVAMLTKLCR